MPIGTVKWFNNAKGFGFILPEDGGEDLFAHYSSIEMDGYKTLKAGQTVEFDVIQGQKGTHATHIRVDSSSPPSSASSSTNPAKTSQSRSSHESSSTRAVAEEHA